VGAYFSGILKSTDSGNHWSAKNTGIVNKILSIAINPLNPQTIFVGTHNAGIFKSTDGGANWNIANTGLTDIYINSIATDPKNVDTIYIGTENDGVFKSTDGGLNWHLANAGLNNTSISYIVIDPQNTQTVYAVALDAIYKSTDAGTNWSKQGGKLPNYSLIRSFVIDPMNPQITYVGIWNSGVYKTTDNGANWNLINTGLTSKSKFINSIVIDPQSTNIIYAGTYYGGGIFKSTDGGANWNAINTGLTKPFSSYILTLAIDPSNRNIIYAGSLVGVFQSTDGGNSWNLIKDGLEADCLAIDPTNTQLIYAGTEEGAFKYIIQYAISTSVSAGGTITPSGSVTVNSGDSQTFTITSNTGYKIKDVKIDGASIGAVSTYTFNSVSSDHTIEAQFEAITFTITASAGSGGSISPTGAVTVNYSDSKTFTITPNSGYKISNVKVDGGSVGSVSSYIFQNITSSHTIEATFEKEITQTVIILQIGKSNFTVNGISNTLDSPPVIKNSRTLLPIRAVIEALGGSVSWDATERKVTVSLSSTTIELWIGKSTAKVNGIDTPIDSTNNKVVPEIINSRTMLPLRFVTENLGCDVQWDGTMKTITIIYGG